MSNSDISDNSLDKREKAIQCLIASYKTKHEGAGTFFLHPSLEYFSDVTGVGVRVQEGTAAEGTVLLTVPNSERVSISNIADKGLKKVIQSVKAKYMAIQDKFFSGLGCLGDIYPHGYITMAVLVLHELAKDSSNEYVEAWPSLEDFKTYCYPIWFRDYQSTEFRQLLRGTSTLDLLERYDKALILAFEEVVKPVITVSKLERFLPSSIVDENRSQMENLWEAFRYASALVRSRSHQSRIPGECDIIPIVDLTNGMPAYCTDQINVRMSTNDDNPNGKTTSLVATRTIVQGRQLILSYGDVRASHFAVRYGCFPREIVHHRYGSLDCVTWRIPTSLGPPDGMRAEACRQAGLPCNPLQIQKWFVGLRYDDLEAFRQASEEGGLPPQLQGLRKFLILCHLLDDDRVRHASLVPGMPDAPWSPLQEGQLFLLVVDHNLREFTSLDAGTNQEDFNRAAASARANALATAHHARICQRDTLAQWRHAICRRYRYESEPVVDPKRFSAFGSQTKGDQCPNQPLPEAPQCLLLEGACLHCGRTVDLKACARCKLVKYCCRDHQRLDWKLGHKKVCDPALAN